jgi:hypothetical protein
MLLWMLVSRHFFHKSPSLDLNYMWVFFFINHVTPQARPCSSFSLQKTIRDYFHDWINDYKYNCTSPGDIFSPTGCCMHILFHTHSATSHWHELCCLDLSMSFCTPQNAYIASCFNQTNMSRVSFQKSSWDSWTLHITKHKSILRSKTFFAFLSICAKLPTNTDESNTLRLINMISMSQCT